MKNVISVLALMAALTSTAFAAETTTKTKAAPTRQLASVPSGEAICEGSGDAENVSWAQSFLQKYCNVDKPTTSWLDKGDSIVICCTKK